MHADTGIWTDALTQIINDQGDKQVDVHFFKERDYGKPNVLMLVPKQLGIAWSQDAKVWVFLPEPLKKHGRFHRDTA